MDILSAFPATHPKLDRSLNRHALTSRQWRRKKARRRMQAASRRRNHR